MLGVGKAESSRDVLDLVEARLLAVRAAENGHLDLLKHLIEKVGACKEACVDRRLRRAVQEAGGVGNGPLLAAAWKGHAAIVRYCIEAGCDPRAMNNSRLTPVFMAACNGHKETVEVLVTVGKVDPSEPIFDGNVPLMVACEAAGNPSSLEQVQRGAMATVRYLVREAGVRTPTNEHSTFLLCGAAYDGSLEMIELLLEAGVSVNGSEGDGTGNATAPRTAQSLPIMCAMSGGHPKAVKKLIDAGADLTLRVVNAIEEIEEPMSIMDFASMKGERETIALLRAAGARDSGIKVRNEPDSQSQRRCFNCGAKDANLSRCGGCRIAEYCGRQCQKTHREMHKEECKLAAEHRVGSKHVAELVMEMSRAQRDYDVGRDPKPACIRARNAGAKAADAFKNLGSHGLVYVASTLQNMADCSHRLGEIDEAISQSRRAEEYSNQTQRIDWKDLERVPMWFAADKKMPTSAAEWKHQSRQMQAEAMRMTAKLLMLKGGMLQLQEAAMKVRMAESIFKSLLEEGVFEDFEKLMDISFLSADIFSRFGQFGDDHPVLPTGYSVKDARDAIFQGMQYAGRVRPWTAEHMQMAHMHAGSIWKELGETKEAVEAYRGALTLIQKRKPNAATLVENARKMGLNDADMKPSESAVPGANVCDVHWAEIRCLHALAVAQDSGKRNSKLEVDADMENDAAETKKLLIAALRDVGRVVEPTCSICLDDLDLIGGKGFEVMQCYHVFHTECIQSYVKSASGTGSAALSMSDDGLGQRAALACPHCKESSGMRVAYGPADDDLEMIGMS